jgi:hypothetical protein
MRLQVGDVGCFGITKNWERADVGSIRLPLDFVRNSHAEVTIKDQPLLKNISCSTCVNLGDSELL